MPGWVLQLSHNGNATLGVWTNGRAVFTVHAARLTGYDGTRRIEVRVRRRRKSPGLARPTLASLGAAPILASRMAESRVDRQTSPEATEPREVDDAGSAGPAAHAPRPEEHSTLKLGTADHPLDGALPAWRTRYEDLGELARGGMSTIRLVYDRVVRRRVAMKVHDRERDPSGLAMFVEEARITGQLDHPNIIPVHDVQFEIGGLPSRFTMKLVEGETLAELLERLGRGALDALELERLLHVFLKVCDAVSFAHSRSVIHCDLKPNNVMVGSHGQVYVTDWGAAQRRAPRMMAETERPTLPVGAGVMSGTPAFMAPEQAWGRLEQIDERTDVYGLGGILYALLTRRPPHDGGSPAADLELAKRGKVEPPQSIVKDRELPPGLCSIAMRALAADPGQRFPTVELLVRQVQSFLRGGGWFETVRLPKDTLVLREGDQPDAAYIVVEGKCEFFRETGGQKRVMGVLGPGEVFGEASIFGSSTRTACVGALTDVLLVRVTRAALERELERTEWLRAFVKALGQRFIEVDRRVRELSQPRARARPGPSEPLPRGRGPRATRPRPPPSPA